MQVDRDQPTAGPQRRGGRACPAEQVNAGCPCGQVDNVVVAGRWLVRPQVPGRGALVDRALAWARRRRERVRGHNPWEIAVHTVRAAVDHRQTGHAAEMSFFALLTLVPSTVAVGAALSFLERFVGPERIARGQDEAIAALRVLMSPRLTDEVIAPFVRAQLSQQRGGVALGGLVLTWWLSSHLFTSTSHALDRAYGVTDRRPTLTQRFIALGFALASVVVVALTLGILVVGPLGGSPDIAERLGLGRAVALTWSMARWPALLLILIGFLICLHRFSPNVEHSWRDCVPGATLGVILWVVAAAGFRLYLGLGGGVGRGVALQDETVAVIGRAVGAVVATVLWTYFSSVAILIGGELNAELARVRRRMRGPAEGGV
jgi:membrane protein